ncbi:MAG: hypothetical protein H7Z41_17750 [Cytophagales bacterium]|nr:hypothetical protein [Armatimonadota bacterium]
MSQRRQWESARRELVRLRIRLQKQMDDAPDAADALKLTEAALATEQERLEKRLAALPAATPPSGAISPTGQIPGASGASGPFPLTLFGRPVTVSVDTRLGFDHDEQVVSTRASRSGRGVLRPPSAVKVDTRRVVSSTSVSAGIPLRPDVRLYASTAYLSQTVRFSSSGQPSVTRSSSGLADTTLLLERRFAGPGAGNSYSLTGGVQLPTGRSPFQTRGGALPTGEGFYQPLLRVGYQQLRVPLQFYGTLDYQTALSRRYEGRTVRLADSYGGQVGFAYFTGPELTVQTALSLRRVSGSPLRFSPRTTEGYLTQTLTYRPGSQDLFQGSLDIGLTNDSLDLFFGLTFRRGL